MRVTSQVRGRISQRVRDVSRRIRRAEVHRQTARRQLAGDRGGDRGLADAALAHHHDEPPPRRRELVDERREPRQTGSVRRRGLRGRRRRFGHQQGAQRRQSHHVEGAQWDLDGGQATERLRHAREGVAPATLQSAPRRCPAGSVALNTPLTISRWLVSPSASSSTDVLAASRIAAWSGRVTRQGRRARGIDERRERGREALVSHLEPRVRPETRGASSVRLEELRPGLRQAEEAQRVTRRRRVEDDVIEARRRAPHRPGARRTRRTRRSRPCTSRTAARAAPRAAARTTSARRRRRPAAGSSRRPVRDRC